MCQAEISNLPNRFQNAHLRVSVGSFAEIGLYFNNKSLKSSWSSAIRSSVELSIWQFSDRFNKLEQYNLVWSSPADVQRTKCSCVHYFLYSWIKLWTIMQADYLSEVRSVSFATSVERILNEKLYPTTCKQNVLTFGTKSYIGGSLTKRLKTFWLSNTFSLHRLPFWNCTLQNVPNSLIFM